MDIVTDLNIFYEKVEQSFERKNYFFETDGLFQGLLEKKLLDEESIGYAQIMISSWNEFLQNLYSHDSTEGLVSNLNNHISLLKRIRPDQIQIHREHLKRICEKLFKFIISQNLILSRNLEIEEDYREYEFNLYLLNKDLKQDDLVLYVLNKKSSEINESSEIQIRQTLRAFGESNIQQFRFHIRQIKGIQETIHTILQLDRIDKLSPFIRKLTKEIDLINNFYELLKQISELYPDKTFLLEELNLKTTQEYPFLDVLKNCAKWYKSGSQIYLKNAKDLLEYIESLKPYREKDIQFLKMTKLLIHLTYEYEYNKSDELQFPLDFFIDFLNNPENNWYLKSSVLQLNQHLIDYYKSFQFAINTCFHFFFKICIDSSIALLYRKKIFQSIISILQMFLKEKLIDLSRVRQYIEILKKVSYKLKEQPLKKMGKFKQIDYNLTSNFHLDEFEKGVATQLLYGFEDILDWQEGNRVYNLLKKADLQQNVRFKILENLYKIGKEISVYEEFSDTPEELKKIDSNVIMGYFENIIDEFFSSLEELFMKIYAVFIIHSINLAFEAQKITLDERNSLIVRIVEQYGKKFKNSELIFSKYYGEEVFSENYEKQLSSTISLLYLYQPVYQLQ